MGLELFVQNPDARLPTVTTIKVRFVMIKQILILVKSNNGMQDYLNNLNNEY